MICVTPEQVHLNATPSLIGSSFKEVMLKKLMSHKPQKVQSLLRREKKLPCLEH